MTADNPTHICQTDARTFKVFLPVQALKNSEEFIGVIHIEADTVVADKDYNFGSSFFSHPISICAVFLDE